MKKCNKCFQEKKEDDFYFYKSLNRLYFTCKDCIRENSRKIINKKLGVKYSDTWWTRRLSSLKVRSARKGLPCQLTIEHLKKFFMQKNCFYCNYQFDKFNRWTIDRVDNSIGYEIDNCVSCCSVCNTIKKDFSKKNISKLKEKVTRLNNIISAIESLSSRN